MPYIGNLYSLPPGSTATPNTTIESAKYNTLINDLANAQNTARPILGGGTGAVTAVAANDALNTQGANIASASTTNIAAATGVYVSITGTTTINSFGTAPSGVLRQVTFFGILQLTYNATSMILPGAANITTAVGDTATFRSLGAGNWRCVDYLRESGQPVAGAITTTDNAIARYDGTGGKLQNSAATIDDSGNLVATNITAGSFNSSTTNALLSTASAGTVLLRPNGVGSATGQVIVANTGAVTINGTLTVTG